MIRMRSIQFKPIWSISMLIALVATFESFNFIQGAAIPSLETTFGLSNTILSVRDLLNLTVDNGNACGLCLPAYMLKPYYSAYCKPIFSPNSQCTDCPIAFDCSSSNNQTTLSTSDFCVYQGQKYGIGEEIRTSSPCSIVHCQQYTLEAEETNQPEVSYAQMSFINVECPEDMGASLELEMEEYNVPTLSPLNYTTIADLYDERSRIKRDAHRSRSCYWSYSLDSCCGERRCLKKDNFEAPIECKFENQTYKEGQKIYSEDPKNSCSYCVCSKDFDPTKYGQGPACKQLDCLSAVMEERIRAGCTPIYHGNSCCPYDYYCPRGDNEFERVSTCRQKPDEGNCDNKQTKYYFDGSQCRTFNYSGCGGNGNHFESKSDCEAYCLPLNTTRSNNQSNQKCRLNNFKSGPIGHLLQLRKCVSCECLVPPLYTCVEQNCPSPPSGQNCESRFEEDSCCPTYVCKEETSSNESENCMGAANEQQERTACEQKVGCTYSINLDSGCGQCFCLNQPEACPTPMCDQGCELVWQSDPCPVCQCSNTPFSKTFVINTTNDTVSLTNASISSTESL